MDYVRHLGDPGRLYDPGGELGAVYFALLLAFLPAERKQNQRRNYQVFINNLSMFGTCY